MQFHCSKRKVVILLLVVILSVAADQITKRVVQAAMEPNQSIPVLGQYLRLTFIYNRFMVFGLRPHDIFPSLPISKIHSFFMAVATLLILAYYFHLRDQRRFNLVALALIAGGAVGNFLDRLVMSKVIDFVDMGLSETLRWPVWNVADACITVGIAMLLLLAFLDWRRQKP